MKYFRYNTQQILRDTIDTIENVYLKNCSRKYVSHWKKVRRRLFNNLLELQLREFDKT